MRDENEIRIEQLEATVAFMTEELKERESEISKLNRLYKNANRRYLQWKAGSKVHQQQLKDIFENSITSQVIFYIDDYGYMVESSYNEESLFEFSDDPPLVTNYIYFFMEVVKFETKMTTPVIP